MQMNKVIEDFYKKVLSYAGAKVEDNIIVNVNSAMGDIKVDGKHLTLPYFENLRNPGDNHIFHPLNENFATPENTHFNLFKKKLICELNLRLSTLIISLLKVGADTLIQQRLKSEEAIKLVSNLGEVELSTVDHFVALVKASQAENDASFLFDIYLKKNGSVGDTAYLAIGKINFLMYRELQKALENKDKVYKAYGYKLPKKAIISLMSAFESIFPNIGQQEDFTVGTDNKVFRYFSALLLASYPVAYRMNEVADLLDETRDPSLSLEDARSHLGWSNVIQDLYPLTDEIREIPNQTCLKSEAHQLAVDESKVKEQRQQTQQPLYQPPQQQVQQQPAQVQQQPQQQVMQQPVQMQAPTAEDIIRGNLHPQVMQPGMMMPGMMPQQQGTVVMTAQGPMMVQQPMMQPQMMMQPGMVMPGMMPQQVPQQPQQSNMPGWTSFAPQPQQPMMQPQGTVVMTAQGPMMVQQPMMQPQQQGIQLNPLMMGRF